MTLTPADLQQVVDYLNSAPGGRGVIWHRSLRGVGPGDGLHVGSGSGGTGGGLVVQGTPGDLWVPTYDLPSGNTYWGPVFRVYGTPTDQQVPTWVDADGKAEWRTPTPVSAAFRGAQITFKATAVGNITSGGEFDIPYLGSAFDTDSYVDGANNQFVIPTGLAGYYLVNYRMSFSFTGGVNAFYFLVVPWANHGSGSSGPEPVVELGWSFSTPPPAPEMYASGVGHLDEGDTWNPNFQRAFVTSGAGSLNNVICDMTLTYIGP